MIALGEWVRVGDWLGREIGDGASLLMSPGTAEQSDDALMTALLARVQQTIAQMNPPIDRCSFSVGIDARLRCDVHALGSGEQRHYLVWLYAAPGTEITHPYFEAGCFDALGVVIGGIAHDLRGASITSSSTWSYSRAPASTPKPAHNSAAEKAQNIVILRFSKFVISTRQYSP